LDRLAAFAPFLVGLVLLGACAGSAGIGRSTISNSRNGGNGPRNSGKGLYFASPQAAVEATGQLLAAKNWGTLAQYYDLGATDYTTDELGDGHFFVRPSRPAGSHPGVWQYRQPFHPAYEYDSAKETEQEGVWEITVVVEIDQGGGPGDGEGEAMIQRGYDTFQMRKSDAGWQLLPK